MKAYSANDIRHTQNSPRIQIVENVIAFIHDTNELLQQEIDLSPANQLVTSIINQLSLLLRSHYSSEEVQFILSNEYIRRNQRKLQFKLSEAEFLSELQDCRGICGLDSEILSVLVSLPTWDIYKVLVSQELRQLLSNNPYSEKLPIVFVGSGPLPLSAIMLHLLSNRKVICLEMDEIAYEASCRLLDQLGLANKVTVILKNGAAFDYSTYRTVFVASLVQSKMQVLEQINKTSPASQVAVRTAEGIRQLRYEAINELQLVKQGWSILGRTSPDQNLVINSTLFLRQVAHLI